MLTLDALMCWCHSLIPFSSNLFALPPCVNSALSPFLFPSLPTSAPLQPLNGGTHSFLRGNCTDADLRLQIYRRPLSRRARILLGLGVRSISKISPSSSSCRRGNQLECYRIQQQQQQPSTSSQRLELSSQTTIYGNILLLEKYRPEVRSPASTQLPAHGPSS